MKRTKSNDSTFDLSNPVSPANGHDNRPVLITGGAGFIGTNVAHRFLSAGRPVIIYDNLSRSGVEQNLRWLQENHASRVNIEVADMRDAANLRYAVKSASIVFHFAAQVAVTTSLAEPIEDFETNARGTLNLLEAIRATEIPPALIFASTNKVYGDLADVKIRESGDRYEPEDSEIRKNGICEKRPLDFHSPYGCSKGSAEQYVLDYSRTFGLPSLVFRMSCVYGLHQFGTEDQGWVAHFLLRTLKEKCITIYGDGKQVRDILFIEDLVNAFMLAVEQIDTLSGQAFNIGGGPSNAVSLLELLKLIGGVHSAPPEVEFADWRSADQQYYVSDIRKFSAATGWFPKVNVRDGITRLYDWLVQNHDFPQHGFNRIQSNAIHLDEAKQLSVMQSHSLKQTSEPRSKRLWKAAHGNDVVSENMSKSRS